MRITELFDNGQFVVTAEVGPPKGIHVEHLVEEAKEYLSGITAVNVTDNQSSVMRMGSLPTCVALKNAGLTPGKDVTIISFDASRHALELVMAGEISYDVECNPLHGPRVEAIIQRLEAEQTPPKLTYVEEASFDTETITQSILDSRGY